MTTSVEDILISNIAQSMAKDLDAAFLSEPGPTEKDCVQCGNKHFTVDRMDELIWVCCEALTTKYTRCNAWHYWLKMRTTLEPSQEEEAIISLAHMADTKAERKTVGCRILNWGNNRV